MEYQPGRQTLVFERAVKVKKGHDSIGSERLEVKLEGESTTIKDFTFSENVKTYVYLAPRDFEKFPLPLEEGRDTENPANQLRINSDQLCYSSEEGNLEYKYNVEGLWGDSFLLCDNFLIRRDEEGQGFGRLIASGNVRAKNEDTVFSGDYAEYEKEKEVMHLYGNPKVWLKDNTVTGDDIFYYLSEDYYRVEGNVSTILFLPENNLKAKEKGNDELSDFSVNNGSVLITSDSLIFNRVDQYAEYIGNVRIENEEMEVLAKRVKIFMDENNSGIKRILAQDDVRIQSGDFVGLGDYALYIDELRKVVLSGPTKIFEAKKIISKGKEVTFFIDQNKLIISSDERNRVKTTLFINSEDGSFGFYEKD